MIKKYAEVSWKAGKVQCYSLDWTLEEAENFLRKYESVIEDAMIDAGRQTIENLIESQKYMQKHPV